jgi:hypothetical protein
VKADEQCFSALTNTINSYISCPVHMSNKCNESCCDTAEKFFPLFLGGGGVRGLQPPLFDFYVSEIHFPHRYVQF